tara:strand:+ start:273 stop:494 length:222 start_codon:yes stop_codon:yes gene_type:complete
LRLQNETFNQVYVQGAEGRGDPEGKGDYRHIESEIIENQKITASPRSMNLFKNQNCEMQELKFQVQTLSQSLQ